MAHIHQNVNKQLTFFQRYQLKAEKFQKINNLISEDEEKIIVIAYNPGSYFHSHYLTIVDQNETAYFNLEQEIIDKSDVKGT